MENDAKNLLYLILSNNLKAERLKLDDYSFKIK
jgi:hypothetical protein